MHRFMDSRFRGNDGEDRGNDGRGRGNDGKVQMAEVCGLAEISKNS